MPLVEVTRSCPVQDSFRVRQVAGMFDVPLSEKSTSTCRAEIPAVGEAWQLGLIVGPSGSGKSTVAREAFGPYLQQHPDWPANAAIVDAFGALPIKDVTGLLTAVGFSSPPSWIKPYAVLSNGERFRCDLARALSVGCRGQAPEQGPLNRQVVPVVVYDEFTSVVDRNVAQVGSAAVAKALRSGWLNCRFVAVTCHYDVAEWLAPDWIVDMTSGTCHWGALQRPAIDIEIFRCHRRAWSAFARHHYLNGALSPTARCFLAVWRDTAVGFCATIPLIGRRGHWRFTRAVTLPDFQGIGIGMRLADAVAQMHVADGLRINITASHPAVIAHCARSAAWRIVRVAKTGSPGAGRFIKNYRGSQGRAVASFEYLGAAQAG